MAKKSNIRSMRFSDEMIEIIEAQAGDTFTAKFEALVTRCVWELPRKEQELKRIQERIDYKYTQIEKLEVQIIRLENNIKTTKYAAERYEYQLRASHKLLQDLCKEET